MIAAWMAYAMLVSALVAFAALALESMLRAIQRPVRFVWASAIAGVLLLSAIAPLRRPFVVRSMTLPTATIASSSSDVVHTSVFVTSWGVVQRALHVLATPTEIVASFVARNAARSEFVVLTVWIVASTSGLLLLAAVYLRYARRRTAWPSMQLFGVFVRVAPNVGPAVIGVAPPEIVIPEWVLSRSHLEQQLVIAHEHEHVRARDPMLLLAGCIAIAIMPWNAALWFMWSRLRLAVELDCDMRVLHNGARKPAYGQLLLELSEQRALLSPIMPAFAFGTSHLEQRLIAMTPVNSRHLVARSFIGCAVGTLALLAACQSELPTASQVEAMDVNAVQAKLKLDAEARYTIDGKGVSKAEADAITADKIASIAVVNAVKGKQVAQVNIKMKRDSGVTLLADTLVLRSGTQVLKVPGDGVHTSPLVERDLVRMAAGVPLNGADKSGTSQSLGTRIRIRGDSSSISLNRTSAGKPLVFVDGVERTGIDDIAPATVNSVEVLKGATAVKLYGERAQYGVINITLKK